MTPDERHQVVQTLGELLAQVEAGYVVATPRERAFISGARAITQFCGAQAGGGAGN